MLNTQLKTLEMEKDAADAAMRLNEALENAEREVSTPLRTDITRAQRRAKESEMNLLKKKLAMLKLKGARLTAMINHAAKANAPK